jgi:hypothetical protein
MKINWDVVVGIATWGTAVLLGVAFWAFVVIVFLF